MKKVVVSILKIIIFFIGWAVLAGIIEVPIEDPAIWRFFAELIPFLVMVVFTVIFLLIEKKQIKIPIFHKGIKGTAVGLFIGALWIAISTLLIMMFGGITFAGKNHVDCLWLWIISAFINVIMQELLVRGYIYQLLKEKFNLSVAVIVTTALFTLMHGGAFSAGPISVINVITMCLFTTALYEAEETILAPIMAHAVWNIVGSLFLGCVSLAEDYPNLLNAEPLGYTLISGGKYLVESSVIVTVINFLLFLFFLIIYMKKKPSTRNQLEMILSCL